MFSSMQTIPQIHPITEDAKATIKTFFKNQFKKPSDSDSEDPPIDASSVFGIPLEESVNRASQSICKQEDQEVFGRIPLVVANCGKFLKTSKARQVEGVFRVNGSTKRVKELQEILSTRRNIEDLDWTYYTVHDVASVLKRYLKSLPEPIIPFEVYDKFRLIYLSYEHDPTELLIQYRAFIEELPVLNQYVLLYLLDLLHYFSRRSAQNLMTSSNLAAIFHPNLLYTPEHELEPSEFYLSQLVIQFLIAHFNQIVDQSGARPIINETLPSARVPVPSSSVSSPMIIPEPMKIITLNKEPVAEQSPEPTTPTTPTTVPRRPVSSESEQPEFKVKRKPVFK